MRADQSEDRLTIKREPCTDPRRFVADIVGGGQPVIVTGLLEQWPAFGRWTPEYFAQRFPELNCRVVVNMPREGVSYEHRAKAFITEMKLPEFVQQMRVGAEPCYYRRQDASKTPGLDDDLDFATLTPGQACNHYLWMGSGGTRTGLHFDMQDNVLCQFYGSKELLLAAPDQSRALYPYTDSITKSRVTPDAPDLQRFPRFSEARLLHGVLNPGEFIYIPNRWWHAVASLGPSISISHEFGHKTNWMGIASAIQAGGAAHWARVGYDFVRYGLLRRPHERRLFDDPPFGRVVFDLLSTSVRRRLGSKT